MKVNKIVKVRKVSKSEVELKNASAVWGETHDAKKSEEKPKEPPKPEKKAEEKPKETPKPEKNTTVFVEEINVKSSKTQKMQDISYKNNPQKNPEIVNAESLKKVITKREIPEIVLPGEAFREVKPVEIAKKPAVENKSAEKVAAEVKKPDNKVVEKKTSSKTISREKFDELYSDKDVEQVETVEIDDINNMALAKNGTLLIKYIGTNEVVHIPDTITTIGKYAFRGNKTAKRIVMSDSVKIVDRFAFAHCVNLEEIVFSRNLEVIGENAFLKCQRINELDFPNSLKTIGKGAFGRCNSLRKLNFPPQLKKINDLCFYSCRNLNRVVISDSIEAVGNAAFSECYSLKKVIIADSVATIGESAFSWCRSIEELVFPSSVKTVGSWAFYGCGKLTDIKISIETKDVREDAFCGCENLQNIRIAEFEGEGYNQVIVKRGHKLILRILKQVNRKKAERYAREHGISMMFV